MSIESFLEGAGWGSARSRGSAEIFATATEGYRDRRGTWHRKFGPRATIRKLCG